MAFKAFSSKLVVALVWMGEQASDSRHYNRLSAFPPFLPRSMLARFQKDGMGPCIRRREEGGEEGLRRRRCRRLHLHTGTGKSVVPRLCESIMVKKLCSPACNRCRERYCFASYSQNQEDYFSPALYTGRRGRRARATEAFSGFAVK